MTALSERLLRRYYGNSKHPYREFEERVASYLTPQSVLLDAGCGRGAPVLRKFAGRAGSLIGVDLVDFVDRSPGIALHKADLASIPVSTGTVDVVMSRSVFEHLSEPESVYCELNRLLVPGGRVVFLTANVWDYATVIARIVPNRLHPAVVAKVEGRAEEDVFPTCYRTNSRRSVGRLAKATGFEIDSFDYLGQYPNYFMFNAGLFFLGTCYDKLVCRFDALRFLRGWILVTLKKTALPASATGAVEAPRP